MKLAEVTLIIDGQSVTVPQGTSLLKAAAGVGAVVPTICYHDHCTANALCRICVVEVEGSRVLQPACVAKVAPNLIVHTDNDRVKRSRRTILEMLDSAVDLSEAPEIQVMVGQYGADRTRFAGGQVRGHPLIDDNPMFMRDYSKCILCWRCVQVCADDAQYTYAINFSGRGFETSIGTFFDKALPETTCVFCGQCVGVCPTGALKPKREHLLQEGRTPDEIMQLTRSQRRRRKK